MEGMRPLALSSEMTLIHGEAERHDVMLEFDWNEAKAVENYARHGVSFELATKVFNDLFAVERIDDRRDYGEERFILIGIAEGHLLFVAYTEREERIRLISARRATKHEQDDYVRQNT